MFCAKESDSGKELGSVALGESNRPTTVLWRGIWTGRGRYPFLASSGCCDPWSSWVAKSGATPHENCTGAGRGHRHDPPRHDPKDRTSGDRAVKGCLTVSGAQSFEMICGVRVADPGARSWLQGKRKTSGALGCVLAVCVWRPTRPLERGLVRQAFSRAGQGRNLGQGGAKKRWRRRGHRHSGAPKVARGASRPVTLIQLPKSQPPNCASSAISEMSVWELVADDSWNAMPKIQSFAEVKIELSGAPRP